MLERRHKEWMTLWNANCDSLNPRRKVDLLHDLDVWERTLGSRAPTNSRSQNLGAQIKDKDFDAAGWAAKHDASFKDLVASAWQNKKQVERATASEGVPNASEPSKSEPFDQEHHDRAPGIADVNCAPEAPCSDHRASPAAPDGTTDVATVQTMPPGASSHSAGEPIIPKETHQVACEIYTMNQPSPG